MDKLEKYNETLSEYMTFNIWIIIFIALALAALIVVSIIFRLKRCSVVLTIAAVLIILGSYLFCIFPYQRDITEESYEIYEGEFYVESCYFVTRGGTYIIIRHNDSEKEIRYKVLCDVEKIEDDTVYNGKFVYSKHSKCLVDIILY